MKLGFLTTIKSFIVSSYKGLDFKTKLLRVSALILILVLLAIFSMSLLVRIGLFGSIPSTLAIKSIKNPISSVLLDDLGKPLGKYFIENRTNVNYSSISPDLIHALIATEDQRFYHHHGIDMRSWARVLFKSILLSDDASGGGSTISQQLAKNLFPRRDYWLFSMPVNKIREMLIAKRLERIYNKEEILTWYLNTVAFGNNIFGIDVACKQLFNTTPEDISIQDAAVLIGMLKATGVYSPLRNEDKAESRRNIVLNQMVRNKYLSQHQGDSLKKLPLKLKYNRESHTDGIATYIREQIRLDLNKILKDFTNAEGKPYNLYTDGLKIHTTLDLQLQRYAEEAVKERMAKLQADFDRHWGKKDPWGNASFISDLVPKTDRYLNMKRSGSTLLEIETAFKQKMKMQLYTHKGTKDTLISPMDSLKHYIRMLNAGLYAYEHKTGKIKAWVGGIDYSHFKYDHVKSRRQVGSTFKPIVMAAALEEGYTPCDYFTNDHVVYTEYDNWAPQNTDGKYGGVYSMEGTLVHSVNCAAVDAILQIGTKSVINMARKLGISADLPAVPSLALGTADISLQEMVEAFSVFANNGKKTASYYIKRIENNKGEVIIDFQKEQPEDQQILPEVNAQLMNQMLKSVAAAGTARGLNSMYTIGAEIAGKTGTTQNQSDGWLICYTPKLTVGSWVGGELPPIRFRSLDLGQGSYMALPICGNFLHKMNSNKSLKAFQGGAFTPMSDDAIALMGCPYYLDEAPEEEDEEEDGLVDMEWERDSLKAVAIAKHKTDTVSDIKHRKRHKKNRKGLGEFIERLFRKKDNQE